MARCWVRGPREACNLKHRLGWQGLHTCSTLACLGSRPLLQVCRVCFYPRSRQDQSTGGRLPRALRRRNCDQKPDLGEAASRPLALPSSLHPLPLRRTERCTLPQHHCGTPCPLLSQPGQPRTPPCPTILSSGSLLAPVLPRRGLGSEPLSSPPQHSSGLSPSPLASPIGTSQQASASQTGMDAR